MGEWKNRPEGYWKDWYWNRGGREKVQYSRKVTQRLFYSLNQQRHTQNEHKRLIKENSKKQEYGH